jgi:predicted CoA-substrate-specific enzyme activase
MKSERRSNLDSSTIKNNACSLTLATQAGTSVPPNIKYHFIRAIEALSLKIYLGIDAGSVSTKLAAIDVHGELVAHVYLKTQGKPVAAVQAGLKEIKLHLPADTVVGGVAATGSARYLVGVVTGADLVKNEITAHSEAALRFMPDVQTVIEIGGQDSKIIIIQDGAVTDFGMNSVCAAGTGSFLDHQAARLNMTIEEFSRRALLSKKPVGVVGKCTVFAESDMIHRQQMGYPVDDIVYGLCRALVRNYLSNVAAGKEIKPPIMFQGGVSFNEGIIRAFEEELKQKIIVPPHPEVMGAIGAALLVREKMESGGVASRFKGMGLSEEKYNITSFDCGACPNICEIAQLNLNGAVLARWGGRCEKWEGVATK